MRQWSQAVARPMSVAQLSRAIEGLPAERIALCLDAVGRNPVDRAAAEIEAVLADSPRAETAALILADAVLSRGMGRDHLLPLLGLGMTARELRLRDDDLRQACYRRVWAGRTCTCRNSTWACWRRSRWISRASESGCRRFSARTSAER